MVKPSRLELKSPLLKSFIPFEEKLFDLLFQTLKSHFKLHPLSEPTPKLDQNEFPFLEICPLFVTLTRKGELRGCIGTLSPQIPLKALIPQMSLSSALNDPRFSPLNPKEIPHCEWAMSLLSQPIPLEGDPLKTIRIGYDGVWLKRGANSSVFLPEVANEQGWDQETLLKELSRKAHLPPDAWKGAKLEVFESLKLGPSRFPLGKG